MIDFEFRSPTTLEEAFDLLEQYGFGAIIAPPERRRTIS